MVQLNSVNQNEGWEQIQIWTFEASFIQGCVSRYGVPQTKDGGWGEWIVLSANWWRAFTRKQKTQNTKGRQFWVGGTQRYIWPWQIFTSISVAVAFILLTLLLSIELYKSPKDFRPGSIDPKPQAALYFLVLFDVALFIWLSTGLVLVFRSRLMTSFQTVSYRILKQQDLDLDRIGIWNGGCMIRTSCRKVNSWRILSLITHVRRTEMNWSKGETNIFALRTCQWFRGYVSSNQTRLIF